MKKNIWVYFCKYASDQGHIWLWHTILTVQHSNFSLSFFRPYEYDTPSSYKHSYLKSTPLKSRQDAPKNTKSSRLIPLWVQFVFFLAVAAFLYIVFANMESNEYVKGIEWFLFDFMHILKGCFLYSAF